MGVCLEGGPDRMCIVRCTFFFFALLTVLCSQITEYLPKGSVEDLLAKKEKAGKKLSLKRIVNLAVDIAKGLNWLHHKGIIHRDLKTANILVCLFCFQLF